jgi:hypothetical protein
MLYKAADAAATIASSDDAHFSISLHFRAPPTECAHLLPSCKVHIKKKKNPVRVRHTFIRRAEVGCPQGCKPLVRLVATEPTFIPSLPLLWHLIHGALKGSCDGVLILHPMYSVSPPPVVFGKIRGSRGQN